MKRPSHPKTILVVEDDPDILLVLQAFLEEEGYQVRIAESGSVVEQLPPQDLPDLIVLDMLVSGTDGRDIAKRLKHQEETKQIPVLMISAHPSAEQEARMAGADDFLAKPFEMDVLLAKVSRALKHEA